MKRKPNQSSIKSPGNTTAIMEGLSASTEPEVSKRAKPYCPHRGGVVTLCDRFVHGSTTEVPDAIKFTKKTITREDIFKIKKDISNIHYLDNEAIHYELDGETRISTQDGKVLTNPTNQSGKQKRSVKSAYFRRIFWRIVEEYKLNHNIASTVNKAEVEFPSVPHNNTSVEINDVNTMSTTAVQFFSDAIYPDNYYPATDSKLITAIPLAQLATDINKLGAISYLNSASEGVVPSLVTLPRNQR